jgi:ATP/maltotriose-dependent transcriptional regulator MalT
MGKSVGVTTAFSLLTNELAESGGDDIVLVLDDYHVITSTTLQRRGELMLPNS